MSEFSKLIDEKILYEKYNEAINLCDKQIERGEDLANAYYQKATAIYRLSLKNEEYKTFENYQVALSLINEAITINDNVSKYFCMSGHINSVMKRYKRAEFDYSQTIELEPSAFNYYYRGLLYQETEKYELAVKDYKKAHELEPDDIDYIQELADSLYMLDQFEQAILYYNKAIEIEDEDCVLFFRRGCAYRGIREYKKAIKDLERAIELNPQEDSYYAELADVYYHMPSDETERKIVQNSSLSYHKEFSFYNYDNSNNSSFKNYNLAIDYLKKAIELNEEESYFWYISGICYNIGNYADAIDTYNSLEEICPDDSDVYFFRGKSYFYSNNFESAITDLNKTIEMQPDNFRAYYFRGMARKKLEDNLLSIGDICFAARNDDSAALEYLHDNYDDDKVEKMLSTTKRYEEICKEQEKLKSKQTEFLDKLYERGKEIFEQKEYNVLLKLCENAISKYEIEHEKIYNLKAAAEIMLEMYSEAQDDCEKALSLNPDFKLAKVNMDLILKKIRNIK